MFLCIFYYLDLTDGALRAVEGLAAAEKTFTPEQAIAHRADIEEIRLRHYPGDVVPGPFVLRPDDVNMVYTSETYHSNRAKKQEEHDRRVAAAKERKRLKKAAQEEEDED